jgi:superfamily II DNA helicase RecQ
VDTVGLPAPSQRSAARAEEARLLYVSLTRAVDRLAITWAERRNNKKAGRSPLLPDLGVVQQPDNDLAPLPPEIRRPSVQATADPLAVPLKRLTTWRTNAARAAGVPATFLLDDATLRLIAERSPTTEHDLAVVEGVGPLLARRFASRILPLLSEPADSSHAAP